MAVPALIIYVGGRALIGAAVQYFLGKAVDEAVKSINAQMCEVEKRNDMWSEREKRDLEKKRDKTKRLKLDGGNLKSDLDTPTLNRSGAWEVNSNGRTYRVEFDEVMPESIKQAKGNYVLRGAKKFALKVPHASTAIRIFDTAGAVVSKNDPFVQGLIRVLQGKGGTCEVLKAYQLGW